MKNLSEKTVFSVVLLIICSTVLCQNNNGQMCPPLAIGETIHAICFLQGQPLVCTNHLGLPPGTLAQINCQHGYEKNVHGLETITCEDDGRWSSSPSECMPSCGTKTADPSSPVSWQVAVYNDKQMRICGGTIISEKLILSAAHCFWDSVTGQLLPSSKVELRIGKLDSQFNAEEPNPIQLFKVDSLTIHPDYKGAEDYNQYDVAILKPEQPIKFNGLVQPLCMNTKKRYLTESYVPTPGAIGIIGIWSPNDELAEIEVEALDTKRCKNETAMSFQPFVTPDKCCIQALNSNATISRGNSGNALALPQRINGNTRYFFGGIITALSEDQKTILIENPDFIINFILNQL